MAEESAPIETEVRREATIVRQVRENDMDLEPTRHYASSTAQSSPSVTAAPTDSLEDIPEDDIMAESSTGLHDKRHSSSFKHQALLNSKGKEFWKSFPDSQPHSTPPPPAFLPLGSSSGISDDISIDSPSLSTPPSSLCGRGFALPSQSQSNEYNELRPQSQQPTPVPTSADITRKVNNKRRRDDDFDPSSFKRRAVSPGMSVQNSPVMQSPMQRDINPWGAKQSNSCGTEKAPVDGAGGPNGRLNGTKRVGLQGMVDTNDGLMKMSIE